MVAIIGPNVIFYAQLNENNKKIANALGQTVAIGDFQNVLPFIIQMVQIC